MQRQRTVEVHAHAPVAPDEVWRVLADPWSWSAWVGGARRIRDADPTWPQPGSRLFHRWGPRPLAVRDHTTVLAADPPRRLVVTARARPWGAVRAELRLAAAGAGTELTLREDAASGIVTWFPRLGHAVQQRRNQRSIDNLVRLTTAPRDRR